MKWTPKANKEPQIGDKKERRWFALFPVKINNEWIWFEKYISIYEYKEYYYYNDVVVSQGILTEKYYEELVEAVGWRRVGRRLIDQ